jgi:hypothetical protein
LHVCDSWCNAFIIHNNFFGNAMKQIKAQGTTLYDANDEEKSEGVVQGKTSGIKQVKYTEANVPLFCQR